MKRSMICCSRPLMLAECSISTNCRVLSHYRKVAKQPKADPNSPSKTAAHAPLRPGSRGEPWSKRSVVTSLPLHARLPYPPHRLTISPITGRSRSAGLSLAVPTYTNPAIRSPGASPNAAPTIGLYDTHSVIQHVPNPIAFAARHRLKLAAPADSTCSHSGAAGCGTTRDTTATTSGARINRRRSTSSRTGDGGSLSSAAQAAAKTSPILARASPSNTTNRHGASFL